MMVTRGMTRLRRSELLRLVDNIELEEEIIENGDEDENKLDHNNEGWIDVC